MILWASAPSVDMLTAQGGVEACECFPNGAVHLPVDDMCSRRGTHLALRFFNEQRLAHSHKGRASTACDTGDMGGDESRISGGGDNGGVHSGLI